MNALLETLQVAALFLVGILARFLVLAIFVAAIGIPIVLFVELVLVARRAGEQRLLDGLKVACEPETR